MRSMVDLYNGYGTTETAIYSTFQRLGDRDFSVGTAYLGEPIGGTYLYVLGQNRQICPVGVVGELYIGGAGVGRGYLQRPELNAKRFVPDPFDPGRTVYRTGDLVRWLPSGDLEYLSRADHQVKVRGHRVELAEIRHHLIAITGVHDAVVTASEDSAGGTRLTGYYTAAPGIEKVSIRHHLEAQLPPYMVPAALIRIPKIPLTPNGKVDQTALPDPFEPSGAEVDSSTALAGIVREAWANVLGVPPQSIDATESFFDVGGDSISANIVVSVLTARGFDLEVVDIFEHVTIEALSQLLRARQQADRSLPSAPSMEPRRVLLELPREPGSLADGRDLHAAVLAALGMALRMLTGARRLGVVVEEPGTALTQLTLSVRDINDCQSSIDSALAGLRAGVAYEQGAAGGDTSSGLAVSFVDPGAMSFARQARRPAGASRLFLTTTCSVSPDALVLELALPDHDEDGELDVVAENLRFALRQIDAALRGAPPAAKSRALSVHHSVTPYNEVFLKDCTHQALATALSFFGGDPTLLAANLCATYELDTERRAGVAVRPGWVEAMPSDALLLQAGVAIGAANLKVDPCEAVLACLDRGALAVIKVDCFCLESRPHFYETKHAPDTFLVFGYDLALRRFDIIENDSLEAAIYSAGTISFDDLGVAHESYCEHFDPDRSRGDLLIVSEIETTRLDTGGLSLARLALDGIRVADSRAEESRAAIDRLEAELPRILQDPADCLRWLHQVHFLLGEIVQGRRLEAFKLHRILGEETLAAFLAATIEDLEHVVNVLTKMRLSGVYSERSVPGVLARLENVFSRERAYIDMRKPLVGGADA